MTVLSPQSPSSPLANVPHIELLKLQITVQWRRPYSIPGHVIANVLRGAVAITFRRLVCPEQFFNDDCPPCPLYENCAYGQLFVPTPPSDAKQLRLQQDLPRPFVIEPPGLDPDQPQSSDRLTFQLILFGSAADWLPFFITTIERLGWDGLGRDRIPFDIESTPAGSSPPEKSATALRSESSPAASETASAPSASSSARPPGNTPISPAWANEPTQSRSSIPTRCGSPVNARAPAPEKPTKSAASSAKPSMSSRRPSH